MSRLVMGLVVAIVCGGAVRAQVASGFNQPLFGLSAPGAPGTLYVVEKGGAVRPLNVATGQIDSTNLLTLTAANVGLVTPSEQGLLGLAFHPQYQTNGLIYAKYTYNDGTTGGGIRVDQFQVTGGVADVSTRRNVLQWNHDATNQNHNAGWIGFNPAAAGTAHQNQLWVMTGDGGGSNDPRGNAQNDAVFQGKVLRVDVAGGLSATNPTYTTPADNSLAAAAPGRPEVYANGLRNPYRASFDRGTGNLYIADVGQNSREEVNFIANGAAGGQNFGWKFREGTIATPGVTPPATPPTFTEPAFEYAQGSSTGRSITGGYVYRGAATDAAGNPLDGSYFFADYVSGRIWSLRYDGVSVSDFTDRTTELGFEVGANHKPWTSFAEDGFGNLYAMDINGGVFLIVPVPEPATVLMVAAAGLAIARAGMREIRRRSTRPAGGVILK